MTRRTPKKGADMKTHRRIIPLVVALLAGTAVTANAAELITPALHSDLSAASYKCKLCGTSGLAEEPIIQICKDTGCVTPAITAEGWCRFALTSSAGSDYAFCRVSFKGSKKRYVAALSLQTSTIFGTLETRPVEGY
jgi:hypothetical protein